MAATVSDALVFFGATGDLAYKQIFPALQALVKRHNLNIPIIGVAKAGWTLDQLKARALDSVTKHGGVDEAAFAKLSSLLQYVDGDYREPGTYTQLKKLLGGACHPLHYLAIPPSMFGPVAEGWLNPDAPPTLAWWWRNHLDGIWIRRRSSIVFCTASFRSRLSFVSTIFSVKNRYRIFSIPVLPTCSSSRSGIAPTSALSRSRWPKISASKAGESFTKKRAQFGTSFKTTCFRCWPVLRWMRLRVRNATRSGMRRLEF